MKPKAVLVQIGDENILHLEVAARVEQGDGVKETFERSGTEVEAEISRGILQNFFQLREIKTGRKGGVDQILEGNQALFELHSIPDLHPEAHAAIVVAQVVRT